MSANNYQMEGGFQMQMDDRKWTILQAIIKTYLETGEPVGSRTISKYPDLNLSSATIRNEMSDLERWDISCSLTLPQEEFLLMPVTASMWIG